MTVPRLHGRAALLALLLGLAGLRLIHLDADPPPFLDISGGSFADEGPWLHNARNWLLYGKLRTDGWNPMLLSPLTHLCGLASMAALGVGLPQARVSAAGVFLLLLLALCLWPADRARGAVAVALLGGGYVAGMFGRLVMVDNMVLLLACAAAALLCVSLRSAGPARSGTLAVAAGAVAALCLITKILVVFLIPAWYAAFALSAVHGTRSWRNAAGLAAAFSAGLGLCYLAYLVLMRWPNAEEIEVYLNFYRSQQGLSPLGVVKNIITQRFFAYFSWAPVFLVLFLVAFWCRIVELWRERRWPEPEEALALLWFLGGFSLLSMLRYRPLRYYLVLLPPMAYVVAGLLVRLARGERLQVPRPLWPLRLLGLAAGATSLGLALDGAVGGWRWSGLEGGMGVSLPRLWLLATLGFLLGVAPELLSRLRGRGAAGVLLGGCLLLEGAGTMSWILHPEYTIEESSRDLARRLPPDAVVTGQFAIQLTFGTSLRAVPVWGGYYNADRPFERYGISHLLLWAYNDRMELRNFEEHFPEVMARSRELHRYWIKRSDVLLYEIEGRSSPGASGSGFFSGGEYGTTP